MKKFYLSFLFAFILFSANAQQPFITTWEVTTGDLSITIPTQGAGYNYTVDFGDGTIQNNVTGDAIHTYSSAGVYTVSISGVFPRIHFYFSSEAIKIKSIEQWGDIQWSSMQEAFFGCSNMIINATDAPDLSQVSTMSSMFYNASSFNQPINHWDVSNVTYMGGVFKFASSFNQPLNNWDVSNVTMMDAMFSSATSFNQPLDNWDVSEVIFMNEMFYNASSFNQSLNNWDVANVITMSSMFNMASSFNQPLNNWNVANVTNFYGMFSSATSFNQSLNNWNVSNGTDMAGMFRNTDFFNQPLNSWDMSNVTHMGGMFDDAVAFDQPLNNWDVSAVKNMSALFRKAESFNQPIDNWDVSNVISMAAMFSDAVSFNQPLNNWNVSNVINMGHMFDDATSFNQSLNNWNVSNVLTMEGLFIGASSFNQDISNWNFNQSVSFGFAEDKFISYSGLDVNNYDALLSHLASLNLQEDDLGAHGLKYCNQGVHDYLVNNLGWSIYDDGLSPNCNTITGTIRYDENTNGCDPNDLGVSGFMVNIDDGTYNFNTFSNNGSFSTGVAGTNFTVSLINIPTYYTATPASTTVNFTSSSTQQVDFCVTANQTIEDLNITLLPISEARPGFEADYQLVVANVGTQSVVNALVSLSFDDSMQTFVNASPAPSSTTVNQLSFALTNLQPFESRTIDLTMQTFTPPTVNGDDILGFTADVTPNANDHTPNDNSFVFNQTVVNSFDPNDKQVLQGETIEIQKADEYLNYLIRFQNTGTASAINVRILDTLHPKLDYSTIKPVSSSHDYRVEITDGNHVEFIFENVNLPHEAANEPGSHGFVAYKIKPKSDVQVGDFITGDARIYFDFNAPIITNTVSTEIVQNMGIAEHTALSDQVIIYPNPAEKELKLHVTNGINLEKIAIYNLQGQEVRTIIGNKETIDIENLTSGMYLLKITTNRGMLVQQLIKE